MLYQIAPPLLIFNFTKMFGKSLDWGSGLLSGLADTIKIGVPVPVPLLPQTFGIVDKGDKNSFSIRTENFGNQVLQRGFDHETTATYTCRRSSTLIQIVLPLIQKCFEFMNSPEFDYDVTYINGETVIFNGKISDFQTQPNADNNDLLDFSFTITTNPSALGYDVIKQETKNVDKVESMPSAGKKGF